MFKCKACTRELEISDGVLTAVCPHCNIKQTLPPGEKQKYLRMHEIANAFMRDKNFEKAGKLYNRILKHSKNDPEAYFGLALCRYGVTYTRDEQTGEYILSVNRVVTESFFSDENYKSAVKYADRERGAIYKSAAKLIIELCEKFRLDSSYNSSVDVMKTAKKSKRFLFAAELFESISFHRDSVEKAAECRKSAEAAKEREDRRSEINRRFVYPVAFIVTVLLITVIFYIIAVYPMLKYKNAIDLVDEKRYAQAREIIAGLGDYSDTYKLEARIYAEHGDFVSAYTVLENAGVDPKEFPLADAYRYAADGEYASAVKLGLYEVVVPESTEKINAEAFINCPGLKRVVLPDSVTVIGRHAFWFCSGLEYIELPMGLTVIGNGAFGASGLKEIVISDTVISIGKDAFRECQSMTSIKIPESVTNIGKNAFSGCDSLTVYYGGTVDEWKNINETDYSGKFAVNCSDGVIE